LVSAESRGVLPNSSLMSSWGGRSRITSLRVAMSLALVAAWCIGCLSSYSLNHSRLPDSPKRSTRAEMLPCSQAARHLHSRDTTAVLFLLRARAYLRRSRFLASQQLDGGSVGAVLNGEIQRIASALVANLHDLPLLGVLLAQLDHALEQHHRSVGNNCSRKRGW